MTPPGLLQKIFARDPRKLARLPEVPVDQALEELRRLRASPAAAAPAESGISSATNPPSSATDTLGPALGNLATHVWRAKNRMVDRKTGLPLEEMKRAYRHVEGAVEALGEMEITMNDWLNQSYDAGLPVKVLTFQPTPGLERDTVVEAIRPAIVWKNQLLQLGEVVVGIPENIAKTPVLSP